MQTMLPMLTFIIALLISAGQFADFLVGVSGDRAAKDKLVDLYVRLNESDWPLAVNQTIVGLRQFLVDKLAYGKGFVHFVFRVGLFSATLTACNLYLTYFYVYYRHTGNLEFSATRAFRLEGFELAMWAAVFVANALTDVLSWRLITAFLGRHEALQRRGAIGAVIVAVVQAYFSLLLVKYAMTIAWIAFVSAHGHEDVLPISEYYITHHLIILVDPIGHPFIRQQYFPEIFTLSFTIIIPHILFLATFLIISAIRSGRQYIIRPLNLILQRSESSSRGLFTQVAAFMSGVTAIVTVAHDTFK